MRYNHLFTRLVFGLALVMLLLSAWAVDTPAGASNNLVVVTTQTANIVLEGRR
jgi:hypothetical protein